MYNLISLLLGLLSWGLGLGAVLRPGTRWLSIGSLLSCGGALLVQLLEVHRRVELGDWTALMDTMDAVVLAAIVLLAVTALLNLAAYFICKGGLRSPAGPI